MSDLIVVIPAIKKNAVIPDQLVKKLNGITLIQRAINTAFEITDNILVITDSEEISLICDRNGVKFYKDQNLKLNSDNILDVVDDILRQYKHENIILYRANTPLVDSEVLKNAYAEFKKDTTKILTSVKAKKKHIYYLKDGNLNLIPTDFYYRELKAFHIFSRQNLNFRKFTPFVIEDEKSIEIEGYQDWWVCEKVLQRKRIIFNVIGDSNIGMGHIYRSLTIAKEITDHEIIFVCDEKYKFAVDSIALKDYRVISSNDVCSTVLLLKPNLVINDCLNSDEIYMQKLKNYNIKIVNFEDLGRGSIYADMVFNELFENAQCDGKNYFWGHEYTLLRDEFDDATVNKNFNDVNEILLSFGGSDPSNLTLLALKSILPICEKNGIKINIVCGSAYAFLDELNLYLKGCKYQNFSLTVASGIMSKIMEKCQLAISSNGRTVYELADMHIPAIVVSHHEREATHTFSNLQRGFINLGVVNSDTSRLITEKFQKLVEDVDYRELLFSNIKRYNFRDNKRKVISKILELL